MTERSLPKWVSRYQDRHGRERFRFRRAGLPTHHFDNLPGSLAFEREYEQLAGVQVKKDPIPLPSRRRLPNGEVVYFIGGQVGPVKIGHTNHLAKRLSELQIGHPKRLMVLATLKGGRELERYFHHRFAAERTSGEWFVRSERIEEELALLRSLRMATSKKG